MEALWTWLSTPPSKGDVLDLFGALCLLLFAPGYLLSAYLAGPGADRLGKDPVQLAGIRQWAAIGLWVFGAGLFFFGARVLQINPLWFGAPIWLVGSIVGVVFAAIRCLDWWRMDYPAERARRLAADSTYPLPDLGSRVSSESVRQTIPKTTVRS
jgi:fatty acid desaturase